MDTNNNTQKWFSDFRKTPEYAEFSKRPVAYFSAEYALLSALPTYAGGLGILSADYIREAKKEGFPILAVGLLYRKAQNSVLSAGKPDLTTEEANLSLVKLENGERVLISLPIYDKKVFAQVWQMNENGTLIYLLDTNISENEPNERDITLNLYDENREMRFKQEMLLGIGGLRLLETLGHHPSVYHLNEGHSAFLALELIHHEMKHQRVDFHTASEYAKKHIVFTNHTLVAAGQEQFGKDQVSAIMAKYAEEIGIPVADIIALGGIDGTNIFSMTIFSFKLAAKANAVSKLHRDTARGIWNQYSMESITNGIYIPRWDKVENGENDLAGAHIKNKKKLLQYIKDKSGKDWSENDLIIGWARRLVPYKRPLALFEDIEKLLEVLKKSDQKIKLVFSGPTRNDDFGSNELALKLKNIFDEKLSNNAVFLTNYSIEVSELMTSGTDIWLNTPVVGSEACGTSGMKALLNGSLPFSTSDGWIAEINLSEMGWLIEEPDISNKALSILENDIFPLYKKYVENPTDSIWLQKMQKGRKLIQDNFSTSRMLKEYIEILYIPTLREKHPHRFD